MTHEHKHRHASEAKKHDGSVDQNIVVQHTLEAVLAILGGKLKVTSATNTPSADGKKMSYHFEAELA